MTDSGSDFPAENPGTVTASTGPLSQSAATEDAWYMKTPEGQIYGPVTRGVLESWVRDGRVSLDCQLRAGEYGQWEAATNYFPLLANTESHLRSHEQQTTGGAYASAAASAYSGPGFATGSRYVQPHRGGMIIAFAILGWAMCPVFSAMAWSMGTADIRQMRNGQMDNSGLGITQAGQILGMIHTCFTLLIVLFMGLFFLLMICAAAADA